MNVSEAKARIASSGKVVTEAPARLLAFSVEGTVPGQDVYLWATVVAPAGYLAEAAQVADWSRTFGDSVVSTMCKPLNGGVNVSLIVK